MIKNLRIEGFRGFEGVDLDPLGQFNLVLGPGNSGKTNLLEAVFVFCGTADPFILPTVLRLRRMNVEDRPPQEAATLLRWFSFAGRTTPWKIEGRWDDKTRVTTVSPLASADEIPLRRNASPHDSELRAELRTALAAYGLETAVDGAKHHGFLFIRPDAIGGRSPGVASIPARFISVLEQGMSYPLAPVWERAGDRKEQGSVIELLRLLDDKVISVGVGADDLGRAYLKVEHEHLGSMPLELYGSGFGKALSIAAYLVGAAGGVLIVDEFDASLDSNTQTRLVEFLFRAAKRHNVQIFASTHSLETVDAFLDGFEHTHDLWTGPDDLRVLQLSAAPEAPSVKNLNADEARKLREEFGFDLRRTS